MCGSIPCAYYVGCGRIYQETRYSVCENVPCTSESLPKECKVLSGFCWRYSLKVTVPYPLQRWLKLMLISYLQKPSTTIKAPHCRKGGARPLQCGSRASYHPTSAETKVPLCLTHGRPTSGIYEDNRVKISVNGFGMLLWDTQLGSSSISLDLIMENSGATLTWFFGFRVENRDFFFRRKDTSFRNRQAREQRRAWYAWAQRRTRWTDGGPGRHTES
jgi:hypothetical protein